MTRKYEELIRRVDFAKSPAGIVPVVIQDASTHVVLMVGYMNSDALVETIGSGLVTFYSRSKHRLWVKGETSKNFLHVVDIKNDCDFDTLLIKVKPDGNVCHTGAETCFNEENNSGDFIRSLEKIIAGRKKPASAHRRGWPTAEPSGKFASSVCRVGGISWRKTGAAGRAGAG